MAKERETNDRDPCASGDALKLNFGGRSFVVGPTSGETDNTSRDEACKALHHLSKCQQHSRED